jgi:hypothetical protein
MGIDWPVTVGAPLDPLFPGNDDDPSTLDEAKWLWNTIKGPIKYGPHSSPRRTQPSRAMAKHRA